jgi:predicted nucleic acid-binding protein
MILVDTSVWISHLRQADAELTRLLFDERVFMHPFIMGELACGNLPGRNKTLHFFTRIENASRANADEVLTLVEANKLYGRGLGWTDVNLLASALIHNCRLWTLDVRLRQAAVELGVGVYSPTVH